MVKMVWFAFFYVGFPQFLAAKRADLQRDEERAKRGGGKPNDKITSNNIDYVDNDFIFVCE